MGAEEQLFLQLLRDHIHGKETVIPEGTYDWDKFLSLVNAQHMGALAYCQLRGSLDAGTALWEALHGEFLRAVFLHTCNRQEYSDVAAALSGAEIPFLPMKGIHLCRYYPVAQLRAMSDIDLVIRPEDRQRCHRVLEEMGFRCSRDLHEVWTYRRDMTSFEVHDWMVYQNLATDFDYRNYFSGVWDHTIPAADGLQIDPSFHFLFLIVHLAKHVLYAGCGFRGYMDLVLMCREEQLDYPMIERELKKMGLWKFAGVCFGLCAYWFGVEMPLHTPVLEAEFLDTVTRKTIHDGVYGLDNEENETSSLTKEVKREEGAYWRTAGRIVLRNLFPAYRDMQLIPAYSFVDGRPWLLPAAWIYRFWYCFRKKSVHSRRKLLAPLTHRKQIMTRKTLMDRWGL